MYYPFASRPIWYGIYKLEMSLKMLRRILLYTVVIVNQLETQLSVICYGIILPLSCLFTMYVAYHSIRVAVMKQVWQFKVSFLCYAYVELSLMLAVATSFSLYYWSYGAWKFEEIYGTTQFLCLYYLYFFNHVPTLFSNLVDWMMGFMLTIHNKTKNSRCCCWKLSKYNIRAMCITMTTMVTVEKMVLFSITWVSIILIANKERTERCFVLFNPVFESLNITEQVKAIVWTTQSVLHIVPYIFSAGYLTMILNIIVDKYHYHNHGTGLLVERGEPQYFGGPIISLALSALYAILKMLWLVFNDMYVFYLYIVEEETDSELYYGVKMGETIMRTIFFVLAPFQLLALLSIQNNFQDSMIRHLNGTTIFEVDFKKTIGGDSLMKVVWQPLPPILTWSARFYVEWLRARPFVWLYECYYEYREEREYVKRMRLRQARADKRLDWENAHKRRRHMKRGCPVRIQIDPPTDEERVETAIHFLNRIRDMEETAV